MTNETRRSPVDALIDSASRAATDLGLHDLSLLQKVGLQGPNVGAWLTERELPWPRSVYALAIPAASAAPAAPTEKRPLTVRRSSARTRRYTSSSSNGKWTAAAAMLFIVGGAIIAGVIYKDQIFPPSEGQPSAANGNAIKNSNSNNRNR